MTDMETRKHQPFVPDHVQMKEFTLRAVLLGLVMSVVLGAANAYLGLRAGVTIAATYPAAVISMAVLRLGRAPSSRRTWRGPPARSASPSRPAPSSPSRVRDLRVPGPRSIPATPTGNRPS